MPVRSSVEHERQSERGDNQSEYAYYPSTRPVTLWCGDCVTDGIV